MSDFGTMIDRIDDECELNGTMDTTIGQHIKDAILLYRSRPWWFTQGPTSTALTSTCTTSDSYVSEYSGLIDLYSLKATVNGQVNDLEPVSFGEMDRLHDGTTSTGQPFKFCRFGGRVRLYPTPDTNYTLTWAGTFQEAALSTASDANDWMTHGEMLIRNHARMTLYDTVLIDNEQARIAEGNVLRAERALDREHVKRTATRRIRPGM